MLTPWKESYNQPKQHIQKQTHYFANKGPSSQVYGFCGSHVWMLELDYKESWVKNWCFWTVVLEKTLESPLDYMEIQSVHPSLVQSLSHVQIFATARTTAHKASLSITNPQSSLKLMSIESAMPSSHLILCRSSPSPPAPNPSQHQSLFQWLNSSWEVAKVLEFRLQHHSLQRNPRAYLLQNGLVGSPFSPRDFKSLLQHHSSKASILRHSAFFTAQLSHPYMTTGKTIAWLDEPLLESIVSAFEYAI